MLWSLDLCQGLNGKNVEGKNQYKTLNQVI